MTRHTRVAELISTLASRGTFVVIAATAVPFARDGDYVSTELASAVNTVCAWRELEAAIALMRRTRGART